MHNCALRLCAGLGLHRDPIKLRQGRPRALSTSPESSRSVPLWQNVSEQQTPMAKCHFSTHSGPTKPLSSHHAGSFFLFNILQAMTAGPQHSPAMALAAGGTQT